MQGDQRLWKRFNGKRVSVMCPVSSLLGSSLVPFLFRHHVSDHLAWPIKLWASTRPSLNSAAQTCRFTAALLRLTYSLSSFHDLSHTDIFHPSWAISHGSYKVRGANSIFKACTESGHHSSKIAELNCC